MVDTKVSDLTEITSAEQTDELHIVDDATGTPASRKITVGNLLAQPFGAIYLTGGSSSQTVAADTWTKFNQFAVNGLFGGGVTVDQANDKITIASTGFYRAVFTLSWGGTSGRTWDIQVRWNGVQQNHIQLQRKIGSSGDVGTAAASGFIDVTSAPTDVEIWVKPVGSSADFDCVQGNLSINRIGAT